MVLAGTAAGLLSDSAYAWRVLSPGLRHTLGNVQTNVECATDIAGKHSFDRA